MTITVEKSKSVWDGKNVLNLDRPVFLDAWDPVFRVYNLMHGSLSRLPDELTRPIDPALAFLGGMPAGGRIRLRTDSPYLGLCVEFGQVEGSDLVAYHSFDLYREENKKQSFIGTIWHFEKTDDHMEMAHFPLDGEMHDYVLYLPLMSEVKRLNLILKEGTALETPASYKKEDPVVVYGSSIVHGVGTARPGLAYPAILSRMLGRDVVNMGFSGHAKAEKEVVEYIARMQMSVFLFDYDHNAPSQDYLRATHFESYKRFRALHPEVPIIFASKVDYLYGDLKANEERRQIILESLWRAKEECKDKHVYFVDGALIYPANVRGNCTQDGCHPNCMGYHYMAKAFAPVIRRALAEANMAGRKKVENEK